MSSCYLVIMRCGHWFRESRPELMAPPEDGEERVCADLRHYPDKYPALYLPDPGEEKIAELLSLPVKTTKVDWQTPFSEWLTSRAIPVTLDQVKRELGLAWQAALETVRLHRG